MAQYGLPYSNPQQRNEMKKFIEWLKSLFKRKPKSARVIVVNGRSVYIKNDDSFTIENGVVRHKDPKS